MDRSKGYLMKAFKSSRLKLGITLGVLLLFSACRDSRESMGGISSPPMPAPKIMSTTPPSGATGVPPNGNASVTFSEAMDPATLNASTFTLTSGGDAMPVSGTVIYGHSRVVFWPTAYLPSNSSFTATITTGATSASGVPIVAKHVWTFFTGNEPGTSAWIHGRWPAQISGQMLLGADASSPLTSTPMDPLDRPLDRMDGSLNHGKR